MTKKEFRKRVCKDIVDGKYEGIEDTLLSFALLGFGYVDLCDTVALLDVIAYITDCGFKLTSDRYCYDRNVCTMSTHKNDGVDTVHFSLNFSREEEVKA